MTTLPNSSAVAVFCHQTSRDAAPRQTNIREMSRSSDSNVMYRLLQSPTELHLRLFDRAFDDLIKCGVWIIVYFALAPVLDNLLQLSRDRRISDECLSINMHGVSVPLLVCKTTYATTLDSPCERTPSRKIFSVRVVSAAPHRSLPRSLGTLHL
jgi:hypothetical protein